MEIDDINIGELVDTELKNEMNTLRVDELNLDDMDDLNQLEEVYEDGTNHVSDELRINTDENENLGIDLKSESSKEMSNEIVENNDSLNEDNEDDDDAKTQVSESKNVDNSVEDLDTSGQNLSIEKESDEFKSETVDQKENIKTVLIHDKKRR